MTPPGQARKCDEAKTPDPPRCAPKDKPSKTKGDGRTFFTPTLEQAAANFGSKIERLPVESLVVLRATINTFTGLVSYVSVFVIIVLLTFVVHQLFIWVDRDPEAAFDQAASALEVVEIVWDAFSIMTNSVIDISNAALIPLWNTGAYYIVEPGVVLTLEVFSLVFMGHGWDGVVSEADFPYAGLDCTSTAEAAAWCGRYAFYEAKLLDEQEAYRNDSLVFGTSTARRLSELADDGTFVTPTFELANVTDALDELTTLGITLGAPIADIGMSVVDEVLTQSAKIIFDMIFFLLRNTFEVLRWIVKSGLLSTLVNMGVDYLIIFYVYWQLPALFAVMDFVTCVLDLLTPSTWPEQLRCIEATCFQGGAEALADLFIFCSYPDVIRQLSIVADAMINSNTGRRFAGDFPFDGLTGIVSAVKNFGIVDPDCKACFNCNYPEMRVTATPTLWHESHPPTDTPALRPTARLLADRDNHEHRVPRLLSRVRGERDVGLYG